MNLDKAVTGAVGPGEPEPSPAEPRLQINWPALNRWFESFKRTRDRKEHDA